MDGTVLDIKIQQSPLREAKDTLEEWHKIFGHCKVTSVQKLYAIVDGMHILNKDKFNCTTCVLGKMTQYRNREPEKRAKQPLNLVGPIGPVVKGDYRYSISFIDEYSGALRIYLIKSIYKDNI